MECRDRPFSKNKMEITDIQYSTYKNAERTLHRVCNFLDSLHKGPCGGESLQKYLMTVFYQNLNTTKKFEVYRQIVSDYGQDTTQRITPQAKRLYPLIMMVFELLYGDEKFDFFGKLLKHPSSTEEQFRQHIEQGKEIIATIRSNGKDPLFHVHKNYLFIIPQKYNNTANKMGKLLSIMYAREALEANPAVTGTLFFNL